MEVKPARALRRLAEMNGVQPSFLDAAGERRCAPPEVLCALLHSLGIPAGNENEVLDSLLASRLRPYRQGIEPAVVAWDGRARNISIQLPAKLSDKTTQARLRFEGGRFQKLESRCAALKTKEVEGERFVERQFPLARMSFGYHTLEILVGNAAYRSLVISAPIHSYAEPPVGQRGSHFNPRPLSSRWGAFLPMYAVRSDRSWGAGNFSDWEQFSNWVGELGGSVAATLPLLAAFLDYPDCEPSPYSPASRLFWNEFYVDITRVPEFARCRPAQSLVRSKRFQKRLHEFRASDLIDYRSQWQMRRQVLELLAKDFFSRSSPRRIEFQKFLQQRPELEDYAAFRAVGDKLKKSWQNWPEGMRNGALRQTDYDESTRRFHLYVQWLAQQQMEQLAAHGERAGVKLYLDLPLGVSPHGYDVWRERESFALEADAGAPPDMFFTKGQNWGFAPLHPHRIRESDYHYVLALLRFQMRHARMLRIDHVMGLHRLYWVPRGFAAREGTYVTYPAEELQAIFNLESHRYRTILVGENLGTVPPIVNRSLRRHRLREMFVVQFEERPDPRAALRRPPALSVASLNTHDTPTFAAHWRGDDLLDCVRLGLLPDSEYKQAKKKRELLKRALTRFLAKQGYLKRGESQAREILRAILAWLSASQSELVLVNLEDLWLERRPQNVPGTSSERPNWRRKTRFTLEKMLQNRGLRKMLSI